MKTGKKVIAAGPGNPPVIVDDTADLPDAARRIVDGASFDNNVLCIAEKEVFAFTNIADRLMSEMERCGAVRIYGADIDKVLKTTLINKDGKYVINRKYVGHDAAVILRDSGVSFTGNPRLIIAETDRNHPLRHDRDAHARASHCAREQHRRGRRGGVPAPSRAASTPP